MHNPDIEASTVKLADATLSYYPRFLSTPAADKLQQQLTDELNWQQASIRLFGRDVCEPRLTIWHADPGVEYSYSGRRLVSSDWPDSLQQLKQRISTLSGQRFNAVLGNLYRDGYDYMGWHSDDETSLGDTPVIASVSIGAERPFVLRRKDNHQIKHQLILTHGSLLIMRDQTQQYWQHALPKRTGISQPRINLTYRCVG